MPPGYGPPGYGPPGHGYGPPPGPPPPRRGNGALFAVLGVVAFLAVAVIAAAVVVYVVTGDDGDDAAQEVFLEPVGTARDPFTAPVGADLSVGSGLGAATGSAVEARAGGEPGLYGGTRDTASCDPEQLTAFLEDNAGKAREWASVLGIDTDGIASYIDDLTPVVLRSDTRVTNHGFADGRATAFQAVLQAGTAVLVDARGQPVTKCYCGNPLTAPEPVAQRYTGSRWDGFDEGGLIVVSDNDVDIDVFVLVDVETGDSFSRPRGSTGDEDDDAPDGTTPPTTAPPVTDPPGTTAPPDEGNDVSGSYTFQAQVAEGSNGNCVAYDGTFEVSVEGSGDDRTVRLDAGQGNVLEGPLSADDSFDLSAPLSNGEGTQTLAGSFTVEGGTVTVSGTGSVDSGGLLCNLTFTGERFP